MPQLSYLLNLFLRVLSTSRDAAICAVTQIAARAGADRHAHDDYRHLHASLHPTSWHHWIMDTLTPRQSNTNVCNRVCNGACV